MKYKVIAFIMALSLMSWAQTATQTAPSAPDQSTKPADTKAACPCCDKMASSEMKDGKSCCAHHDMAAKDGEKPACCQGKEGMSCNPKDKTAGACCGGDKCGKDGKGCCASDKSEKTAASCCQGEHCSAHSHSGASK